jgi:hypothetical protein
MRIRLAATIVAVAMLASSIAFGQAPSGNRQIGTPGTSGRPAGPAVGGAIPPTKLGAPPPGDALGDLAGGGYADPNYVQPGTHSGKTTRHRGMRTPRARWASSWASHPFVGYNSYKAFPYSYCFCHCDY